MLKSMEEGKVYEVLLVTSSNVTPVGVIRKGGTLRFKLFPGKGFKDILKNSKASIQATNNVEFIVRAALNLPLEAEFKGRDGFRWIKGLPGHYGRVEYQVSKWKDEVGESRILLGTFIPVGRIPGSLPPIPPSRADCTLLEMAVHFTRFLLSRDAGTSELIKALYCEYTRLGGHSEIAEYIVKNLGHDSR